jgi:hypothetical protein
VIDPCEVAQTVAYTQCVAPEILARTPESAAPERARVDHVDLSADAGGLLRESRRRWGPAA